MAVRITKSDLTQKVEEGWKKDQLAQHYGLPMSQMTKVLQQAGLQIRKFHRPKFELVDDTVEVQSESMDIAEDATDIVPDIAPNENDSAQW